MPSGSSPVPFPEFLKGRYQPGALDTIGASIAVLDVGGTLLWVNDAWYRFARANGCEFAVGRYSTYCDGITGPLRAEYEHVLAGVVATGTVFEQSYECSSPEVIRHFRMRVLPFLPDGLLVEHTETAAHLAPLEDAALEELFFNAHQLMIQCSNCRRVRRPGGGIETWVWVPQLVARSHPRTSHGLCTPCLGYYWSRPIDAE